MPSQSVNVVEDGDQYSTDLMKCVAALREVEVATAVKVRAASFVEPVCAELRPVADQSRFLDSSPPPLSLT